jgi:hypothetical protein
MNNPITPLFYQVIDFHILEHTTYNISKSVGDIALIKFSFGDLSDPATDPIAMYSEGGIRKYLWKGSTFGEYAIDTHDIHKILISKNTVSQNTAAVVLELLVKYLNLCPPSTYHKPSSNLEYCRAIWKINKGNLR